jgi:predicted DNA-binding protein YlxM (UPF0122 family)
MKADMNIREQMIIALQRQAISNLIDKKYELDEAFEQGLINYAEYEERKWLINNEIESLTSE